MIRDEELYRRYMNAPSDEANIFTAKLWMFGIAGAVIINLIGCTIK